MKRKYLDTPIDQLETLVSENLRRRQVLGEIRDELTFRKTPRARQLLREVDGLLRGAAPMPPGPRRPESNDDQLDLMPEDE